MLTLTFALVLAAAPFEWRLPPALADVEVPGTVVSGGVPVKLRAVLVDGRVEALAPLLAKAFAEAGLYLAPVKERDRHLTALDVDRLVSYTVLFEQTTPKRVTLLLGEADLRGLLEPRAAGELPLPPGARDVVHTQGEGLVTTWFTTDAMEEEVRSFYRTVLEAAGWREREGGVFDRLGATLSVAVKPLGPRRRVLVTQTTPQSQGTPP